MEQTQLLTLIQQCRAGDRAAQERLVMETQNRVYYHCKRFLKNDQDAQDATQDVLIAMLTSLDKLKEPAAFWGWLNGITANRCRHLLTQGTKEWQIPEDDQGNSMLDSIETLDDQTVPDKVMDNAATQRLILDIIDSLPAEQRMTVTFFYYDEMSVKDIAAIMEVSEGTVKSRLNYARKAIKAEVEKLEKKDGTKLYAMPILPFLAYFLHQNAQSQALSPAVAQAITQSALAGANASLARAAVSAAAEGTWSAAPAPAQTVQTAQAAAEATKAAAATAGKKAAGMTAGRLVAAALAGTLAAGGIGAGIYVATHQDAGLSSSTPEPVPYTQVYAQAVEDREADYGDYLYDLVYIDGDDIPELVVEDAQRHDDKAQLSIYTAFPDGSLQPVREDWTFRSLRPEYYPRANILDETTMGKEYVDLLTAYVTVTHTYYRMGESGKAEEFYSTTASPHRGGAPNPHIVRPPEVKALGEDVEPESIKGVLTAQELLDQLNTAPQSPIPAEPIEAPTPPPAG